MGDAGELGSNLTWFLSSRKLAGAAVGRKDLGTRMSGGVEQNDGSAQFLLGANCGPQASWLPDHPQTCWGRDDLPGQGTNLAKGRNVPGPKGGTISRETPGYLGSLEPLPDLWRRRWQPTLVSLSGESHGQRVLAGHSPQGRKESDTTEQLITHAS